MYKLNRLQLKQLADFTSNLSLVFFATVVGPLFSISGAIDPFLVGFWYTYHGSFITNKFVVIERHT